LRRDAPAPSWEVKALAQAIESGEPLLTTGLAAEVALSAVGAAAGAVGRGELRTQRDRPVVVRDGAVEVLLFPRLGYARASCGWDETASVKSAMAHAARRLG
jgi:hypothetical protein